jgi:serine/threonine protein kinase
MIAADSDAARLAQAIRTEEIIELDKLFVSTATDNFDDSNVIGQGAFGKVYKGRHQGVSARFAVKKLDVAVNGGVHRRHDDFSKEIEVLSRFQHPHIIRLYGFSSTASEQCLVYELGIHGSLADCLVNDEKSAGLPWKLRIRISIGLARH